jgi:hypothetical protein
VGAELVALDGIERALEQGAEDGGLDVAPVLGGGLDEELELVGVEREGAGLGEEVAVESADVVVERIGEAAGVHALPEFLDLGDEGLQPAAAGFEELEEAVLREQLDILGEHGEERAHEEGGDRLGAMSGALEQLGEAAEFLRDGAGDLGGAAGGVEREGIGPDEAEAFADLGLREIEEAEAMGAGIGERDVGAAGAGEFGVELDGVADIDDDEKGRAAFAGRQGARPKSPPPLFRQPPPRRAYCSAWPRALSMASSHAVVPRMAVPFLALFSLAWVTAASAAVFSFFSTPCLASRMKQPRL